MARNANGTPHPDLAAYGAGWITKVGWLGSSRTYGWTRFGESGREFDAGAGRSRVVPWRSARVRRVRSRYHGIAGVTVAPIVMQRLDRRHSAIRTR